jgi:hypothetical protein
MIRSCTVQARWLAFLLLLGMAVTVPVASQGGTAASSESTPPKTVTWYADNPRSRAQVQLACMDNPGQLSRNADCINAQQASVEVALRAARSRTGTMNPKDPDFWSADPNNRRSKLIMCRLTPQLDYCDVARRSLLIEAGQAHR